MKALQQDQQTSEDNDAPLRVAFEPLVRPRPPLDLSLGRLVMHANWARTWTWDFDDAAGHRRTEFAGFTRIRDGRGNTAWSVTMGPFKLTFGWA